MGPGRTGSKHGAKRQIHSWITSVPGLILIDSSFAPIALNDEGAAILAYPKKPKMGPGELLHLPQAILDEIDRHRLTKAMSVVVPFQAGRREYVCHAFRIKFSSIFAGEPIYALILQRNSSADETVWRMAAQFNLTERERETLHGISIGLTSKELATRMRISPNTVKAYLHLVMVKMGVTSRAGIVAKILEQNSGGGGELVSAITAPYIAGTANLRAKNSTLPRIRTTE
jgi:DNA-binding CsgD family transcriptional regulator